jgi:hypothetical protein
VRVIQVIRVDRESIYNEPEYANRQYLYLSLDSLSD